MLKIQQLSSRYSQYKEQLKAKNLLLYPFDKIRAYSFSLLVIYHDVITLSKIHMFIETKKKKKILLKHCLAISKHVYFFLGDLMMMVSLSN